MNRLAMHNRIKKLMIIFLLLFLPLFTLYYNYLTPDPRYEQVPTVSGVVSNKEIVNYYGGKSSRGHNEYLLMVVDTDGIRHVSNVTEETYFLYNVNDKIDLTKTVLVEGHTNKDFFVFMLIIFNIAEFVYIVIFNYDRIKKYYMEWLHSEN